MVGFSRSACALCHWASAAVLFQTASALATSPPSPADWVPSLSGSHDSSSKFKCDLPAELDPAADGLPSALDVFSSDDALKLQVYRHSEIVKVPSISYDDNGEPGEDPRWDVFYKLHDTLERLYPKFHARATRETVNTFGLVYTLKGSDSSLKPLMLTAHQDVVPVADASTWKYPPFSAHFDGRWLWGRGASDDKNSVTGLFSALEALLDNPGWEPKRDIVLAMGFDEECSGRRGAGTIGKFLLERYGEDSMAFLLDEGGMGLKTVGNVLYALPAVMEKGHVDVWFDLTIAGGHSSTPYPHTGIGVLSQIVSALEAHPYSPKLIRESPVHNRLVCQARYSPEADRKITKLIRRGDLKELAEEVLVKMDRATQYSIQTSQSVDYFHGGVKINAMPERIRFGVNHRIAPHDSVDLVKENILKLIKPVVKKFRLTVKAFEGEDGIEELLARLAASDDDYVDQVEEYNTSLHAMYDVDYNGTLVLSTTQITPVAPVSPTSGDVWDVFSGTIRHSFAFDNGTVVPVGDIMTGNTDTRHYLDLTRHVYRWMPTRDGHRVNAHTVDEGIDMLSHMEVVRFYYDLVRNFDASKVAPVVPAAGTTPRLGDGEEEVVGEL